MSALETHLPRRVSAVVLGANWTTGLVHAVARRLSAWSRQRSAIDDADDAAAVRERARRHMKSDPGFAADLFAAADCREAELMGKAALRGTT